MTKIDSEPKDEMLYMSQNLKMKLKYLQLYCFASPNKIFGMIKEPPRTILNSWFILILKWLAHLSNFTQTHTSLRLEFGI